MRNYKELVVWKKSIVLAAEVYSLTKTFPREEAYSLSSQMHRAVVSIASNIAEGYARYGDKELLKFLFIARGSKAELETQLYIACEVGYITEAQAKTAFVLSEEIGKIIGKLISKIEKNN